MFIVKTILISNLIILVVYWLIKVNQERCLFKGELGKDDETETDKEKERLWEKKNSNYGEKSVIKIFYWLVES